MANFDELFLRVDPVEVAKQSEAFRQAREDFPLPRSTANDFQDLLNIIVRFMNLSMKYYLSSEIDWPPERCIADAEELLGQRLANVYDSCLRGINGGVPAILNRITEKLSENAENKYIDYQLDTLVSSPTSYEEIEELMTDYRRKFGRYLPFHLRNIGLLCLNWREILKSHARLLSHHRTQVGQL